MEPSEFDKPSLMQKWRMHYNSRDFKPKDRTADRWGIMFFLIYTPSLLLVQLFIVLPELERYETNKRFFLACFMYYLFIQTVYNWVMIIRKSRKSHVTADHSKNISSQDDGQLLHTNSNNAKNSQDWKDCVKCQVEAPPRSHHCKICKVCVMKRDHHCFFTGTCIGFHTQRYFAVFAFYSMVSSLTVIIMSFLYLNEDIPFWSSKIFYYFPPIALYQVLAAHIWATDLLVLIQLWFAMITFLGGIMFFFWEMLIIYRGQTSFEAWMQVHLYRVEPIYNFRSVFGSFWPVNFLLPFIPTTQQGDGLHWEKHKRMKGH